MNKQQVSKIRHALGLDHPRVVRGRKYAYRCYYVAPKQGDPDWEDLLKRGLCTVRRAVKSTGGHDVFHPTRATAEAVLGEDEFLDPDVFK